MKKKISFSLLVMILSFSIFVGGCSCSKDKKPENPNAKVILANEIVLDKNVVSNVKIGEPFTITYTINPSNTTDKTMLISTSDSSVATIDKTEVTGKQSDSVTVTPVGVGTVNIIFTWSGTFDNDEEKEERTLKKATTVYVVGEQGKETLNTPTNLTYNGEKFTWSKVSYGKSSVTSEPVYELSLTGGAAPTTPVTLDTNEYEFNLTAGVNYTAKVKAKPTNELQNLYTASAFTEEIEVYKLPEVTSFSVENGVVTFDAIEKANKYVVNVNGVDEKTITANVGDTEISFDAKEYLTGSVTELEIKVKAINDVNDLVFDGEYSVNVTNVYQLGVTSNYALSLNSDETKTTLTWDTVEHATGYMLEIVKVGESEPVVSETLSTNSFELPITLSGTYNARVKAIGNSNTLSGSFTEYYNFTTLDVNSLTASLSGDEITYSITNLNGNKIVFEILNEGETIKVEKLNNSGSFNVRDYVATGNYIVLAKLVPSANSNFVISTTKVVGQKLELALKNTTNNKTNIVWGKIKDASNYSLVIDADSSPLTFDNIANVTSGLVEFEIDNTVLAGAHTAKVKASVNGLTLDFGEVFNFTKLDANDITTNVTSNVLSVSYTNTNIEKVIVYVKNGSNVKTFNLVSGEEIDFATLSLATGEYSLSVQAVSSDNSTYAISEILDLSNTIKVFENPEISSIDKDGKLTWNTNSNYGTFTVYIDKGEANEQILTATTNEIVISSLSTGEHTAYVVANAYGDYLASSSANEFTFTKLGLVENVKLENGKIVWDNISVAGSYEVIENGNTAVVVTTNEFIPTQILQINNYKIKPIGNGTNSVTGENQDATFYKLDAVSDLGVSNGYINFTNESDVTYKMFVNENEIVSGLDYTFTGVTPYELNEVYVLGFKEGFFDSDKSNVLKVKKLGLVSNIAITSIDKEIYNITWDAVTGANSYIVNYNNKNYVAITNSLQVVGELPSGNYGVKITATYTGSDLITESDVTFGYVIGDESEVYTFEKLSVPTSVQVKNGVLTWEYNSVTQPLSFELEYSLNNEEWTTKNLGSEKSNDLSFLSGGTYYVKIRAVGNNTNIISSDFTPAITVIKNDVVSGLKVKNGEIVWDSYSNDESAYVYDVYVYTNNSGTEVLFGTPEVDYNKTSYTIPSMAENTEYFIKIVVKNATGGEIYSNVSNSLKVVKLNAPTNFGVLAGVASWDAVKFNSEIVTNNYKISLEEEVELEDNVTTYFDITDGKLEYTIPNNLKDKTSYNISVMAKGTLDSLDTMEGYLNSDYTSTREVYKLSPISNLRVEDGEIRWDTTYTSNDKYGPVEYKLIFTRFVADASGNVETHEFEDSVAWNVTNYRLSDATPGEYKLEFYVMGDGVITQNSIKTELGGSERIKKLSAPKNLRMQDGELVWDEGDINTPVTYVLYNDDVELTTKNYNERTYIPNEEIGTVFNITIKAEMENAIYSEISDTISIYQLNKVTNFRLDDGKFKWTEVENATGYTIVLSYEVEKIDPETGSPVLDEVTNEPVMEAKEEKLVVDGGNTTEVAIPTTLPKKYSISKVYANGNTTSTNTNIGYFNSMPIDSSVSFTPLSEVDNLTVDSGNFVWNKVTGADYYSIEILDTNDAEIKKVSTTTNSYTLTDDENVPSGNYKFKITPISRSDEYLTTYIPSTIDFVKMPELTNVRIENGYIAWNVLKADLAKAYVGNEEPTPDPGVDPGVDPGTGGGGIDSHDDGASEEIEFTADMYSAFYNVAVGSYVDNADTAKFYSFAYIKLKLTSLDNSKVVTKIVQPFNIEDPGKDLNYITCYYFLDAEVDTWKISISAKGNTVNASDTVTPKYVDGMEQKTFLTASKLDAPVCPVHINSTPIVDGKLIFTPVKLLDGTLYNKYIIEAVPTNLPVEPIITKIITVTGEASQTFDVMTLGLKSDIVYNISIKTLGTESGNTGDLFLNSNTPVTTSLIILGTPGFTVTGGVINWNSSAANSFKFTIKNSDGSVDETFNLESTVTMFELDENYAPSEYKVTIQAIGDGINKISSSVSETLTVVKNGTVTSIVLNNGNFVFRNVNPDNGYKVLITQTREDSTGATLTSTEELTLTQIEKTDENIIFSLPSNLPSYIVEGNNTYYYRYSIQVMLLGSENGVGGVTQYVNGEYSEPSYAYQRLNTPTNVRVNNGEIIWNDVSGARGYQINITGQGIKYTVDSEGQLQKEVVEVEQENNVGSDLTYKLSNDFLPGVYHIKIRALGGTPDIATPNMGYLTGNYSDEIVVVRVAEPLLRVDRGEVVWNSVAGIPFEATSSVKVTINGLEEIIKNSIDDNIGLDFDDVKYPAGEYTIKVQFIGNNELINGDPYTGTGLDNTSTLDFYYLSSKEVTKTFTKLNTPEISLGKVDINDDGDKVNVIMWNSVENATRYDVYVVTEVTELVGEDDPNTEEDERQEVTKEVIDVYTLEDNSDLFGTQGSSNYFRLNTISYEDYNIYIRAVGNDTKFISSTRSNNIHIHTPLPPKNLKYDSVTGTISWINVSEDSKIVLDIRKYNESTTEYEEVVAGGIELDAKTTTYKLNEVGDYRVRIKSRLSIIGGSYDSDYSSSEPLLISFKLFNSGSGTSASPYYITTEAELNNIRYFLDRTFEIRNNIALSAYSNWAIIGNENAPFTGKILGNGYTISNFRYTNATNTNIAFIHTLGKEYIADDTTNKNAEINNLKIEVSISSNYMVRTENFAGFAINNNGNIKNSEVSGDIYINGNATNETRFAGVTVYNNGLIENVTNNANLSATRSNINVGFKTNVAGIAVENHNKINRVGNNGSLEGQWVGGVVCRNYNAITNAYNMGSLKALSAGYTTLGLRLGGIAATNEEDLVTKTKGTIDTCYVTLINDSALNSGRIVVETTSGATSYIGGVVGFTSNNTPGSIANCYALVSGYDVSAGITVASLVGIVSYTGLSNNNYFNVLSNCYSYSSSQTMVTSSAGNTISKIDSSSTNYSGKLANVADYQSNYNSVQIPGITVTQGNPLPKFTWQELIY